MFGTSPRLIAAYHVLRRLSAPKHPPHTLSSLTTEFGLRGEVYLCPSLARYAAPSREDARGLALVIRLGSRRCGNPCSDVKDRLGPALQVLRNPRGRDRARGPGDTRRARSRRDAHASCRPERRILEATAAPSPSGSFAGSTSGGSWRRGRSPRVQVRTRAKRGRRSRTVGEASVRRRGRYPRRSLIVRRKEVIQPQVLLRLPCYDLVPIIELTFGTFLPCGLERRLRVLPTFVA